ncbi:GNAT family N-acetyltransferase [Bacillus sp. JJ1566]|uniref:GNAT family N-acetyltransferase n=1 Tax=Bacillus sp. JJ1566 TaxID=3122961 RepID=UPI0030003A8A
MIRKINIQHEACEVLNIQTASYKFEAELIGTSDIPPLKDTVDSLQQSGEIFYGYCIGEEVCGVIAFKVEGNEIDIYRLFVHPNHFRKGIAQMLLHYIESKYGANTIKVATGTKNIPAIHFYQKNGFEKVKEVLVDQQLSITYFIKKKKT